MKKKILMLFFVATATFQVYSVTLLDALYGLEYGFDNYLNNPQDFIEKNPDLLIKAEEIKDLIKTNSFSLNPNNLSAFDLAFIEFLTQNDVDPFTEIPNPDHYRMIKNYITDPTAYSISTAIIERTSELEKLMDGFNDRKYESQSPVTPQSDTPPPPSYAESIALNPPAKWNPETNNPIIKKGILKSKDSLKSGAKVNFADKLRTSHRYPAHTDEENYAMHGLYYKNYRNPQATPRLNKWLQNDYMGPTDPKLADDFKEIKDRLNKMHAKSRSESPITEEETLKIKEELQQKRLKRKEEKAKVKLEKAQSLEKGRKELENAEWPPAQNARYWLSY